jgi:hypothetical protein
MRNRSVVAVAVLGACALAGCKELGGEAGSVNYTPTGDASSCPGYCAQQNGLVFLGVATVLDFDAIEAQISMSGLSQPLQVRELCVK